MAIFDRNYDYGYRAGANRGYDRDMGGRMRYGWNETKDETREMLGMDYDRGYRGTTYDRDRNWNRDQNWNRDRYGAGTYDRNYYGYGTMGYDRGYKSRWETDYGDPFGDRTSRTPIRVMNEEFHGRYDRDMTAGPTYDRNYRGVGYDPYYGARGYDRTAGYRGWGTTRGYDRGWF